MPTPPLGKCDRLRIKEDYKKKKNGSSNPSHSRAGIHELHQYSCSECANNNGYGEDRVLGYGVSMEV